ncbi:hypothetical protein V8F06_013981 [Rhypophila decipiens]
MPVFPFCGKKSAATKTMPPKPLSESSSMTRQDETEAEKLFRPYASNKKFVEFTLDEGLDVLVLNEGSFKLNQGYSDKRVVLTLSDHIHDKITLQDASRTIRDFVPGII